MTSKRRSKPGAGSAHVRFLDEFVARQPDDGVIGLLVMQLDKLNRIQTSFGRERAAQLSARVVAQLRELLPPRTPVIRLRDRHIAIHVTARSVGEAFQVANSLIPQLDPRIVDQGHTLNVGANVGVAYYPEHGKDATTLYRHAEMALQHAKDADIPIHVYQNDATSRQRSLWRFESELQEAVRDRKLEIYYQPQYSLPTKRVSGVEALVRWRRPSGELMQASEFVPAAERAGCMSALTWFLFEDVAEDVQHWMRAQPPFSVAVNISPKVLEKPEFSSRVATFRAALQRRGMDLILELTEEALVQGGQETLDLLAKLREDGIGLAIDDFGQGYSSLNYLKRIPATEIKIDKQFVSNMALDSRDEHIVKTTIDLAEAFEMRTVAEGVDNPETLQLLAELECETVQGFLVARPMSATALGDWLKPESLDSLKRALARPHRRVVNR